MPSPYKYFFNEDTQTYQFITQNDFTYSIAFLEDATLDSLSSDNIELKDIYQIVIEKVEDTKEPFDANVSCTINQIIFDFFSNFQNVIIYICSDDDKKEVQRFNAFNRWYQNSNHKDMIEKIDNVIDLKEKKLYTSLMIHKENNEIENIIDTFNEIETALLNPDK